MTKTILIYGLALVATVLVLEWVQYQYVVRAFSTEWFVVVIALAFAILGAWVAVRLMPDGRSKPFRQNDKAIAALKITPREIAVLSELAQGQSNKEAAKNLGMAPNTVKTHVASLFRKLEVSRRTQAIKKARSLSIIR